MKIKEITQFLESIAPLSLQENYDNSGLLIGDSETEFLKALICLDITSEVIDEAIIKKCNLIISHHPLIFGKISKITPHKPTGKCIINAIKNDIAIYAIHTNFDNIFTGVNAILCKKLGIENYKILKPKQQILKKVITFCPVIEVDKVRNALFNAGAGLIGNYDSCSYNTSGKGSFRALEGTNPYVGEKNQLHFEEEIRIETIFPSYLEKEIINALLSSHPYEEVAYDIYSVDNAFSKVGEGMIGELKEGTEITAFFDKIKKTLGTGAIKHSKLIHNKVKKIAVCGGSGGSLIGEALLNGADLFLTADLKYHQFFDGQEKMILADIGHYESEQFTKEIIVDFLNKKFPTFAFLNSFVNTNSVNYF